MCRILWFFGSRFQIHTTSVLSNKNISISWIPRSFLYTFRRLLIRRFESRGVFVSRGPRGRGAAFWKHMTLKFIVIFSKLKNSHRAAQEVRKRAASRLDHHFFSDVGSGPSILHWISIEKIKVVLDLHWKFHHGPAKFSVESRSCTLSGLLTCSIRFF